MMTGTDRRRFPILIAAIAVLALAVAVSLLSSGDVSRAQQAAVALVSNTSESVGIALEDAICIGGSHAAIAFTVGDDNGGYALTALDVMFYSMTNVDVTLSLWSAYQPNSSWRPSRKLFEFDNPSSFKSGTNQINTFTPPQPFYLHDGWIYFLVAESDGLDTTLYCLTNTTSNDEAGLSDWGIFGQALRWDGSGQWPDSVDSNPTRIPVFAIHGYELDRLTYNTGESTDGYYSVGSSDKDWLAQGFFTSGGTNGWDLHSVALDFGQSGNQGLPSGPGHITVSLYSDKRVSGDSVPHQKLFDFNDPPLFSAGDDNEFTAPEGSTIAPSTAYLIVIRKHGGDSIRVRKTSSAGQDGYSAFSIRDVAFRSTDGNSWEENDDTARMKLYGKSRSEPIDSDGVVTLSPTSPGLGVEITATLTDADGSVIGSMTWQWSSASSASGTFTDISGATSDAYTTVAADIGNYLKATVSYTDALGPGKSAEATTDNAVGRRLQDKEFVPHTDNTEARDIWSDGTTMWVADSSDDKLYAYALADGTRQDGTNGTTNREFNLHSDNDNPFSMWSDGTTMWVADNEDDKLYAYVLKPGTGQTLGDRLTGEEFDFHSDNPLPYGIWSDGTTMWVADDDLSGDDKLYAYVLKPGTGQTLGDRLTGEEFDFHSDNSFPYGIWSDGTTMWVANNNSDKVFAYTLSGGARDDSKEFDFHSDNTVPRGIWSDYDTMWVADSSSDRLYAYYVSDITGTRPGDIPGVVRMSTENPVVGELITAGVVDADGVIGTLSLQWSSASNATGPFANIPGETSQTYTPVTGDIGKFLKVTISYDDGHGTGKSAEKVTGSAVVAATGNSQPEFDSSENGRRSVAENDSGASVGSPLAATDGNSDTLYFDLSGPDSNSFEIDNSGQLSLKSGVSLNYEDKDSYSFSVTVSDRKDDNGDADTAVDDTLSVTVSVTNMDEDGTVRLSTNSPRKDSEVTASLSDPDGSVSGTSWRWSRANSINGTYTNITGATSRRYTPDDDDVDKFLRARVTYTDGHGPGKDASRKSTNAVSEEASVDIGGVVTLSPRNPAVGVDVTAELFEYDEPTSGESWQWSSSSSRTGTFTPISGATSSTYTPVAGDAGEYLKAKVEYTDGHGPNKSAEAVTVNAVASEPEPTGNRPGEIRAYWTDSDTPGSNLQVGCSGTEPFRAYWKRPKRADDWEAEVTADPRYGASNVTHSTIGYIGDGFHALTGTVRTNGFSTVSIRVRGRFGDDGWGAWSPVTELLCLPEEDSGASSAQRALQGRFVSPPGRHDGSKRIKIRVAFSEAVDESPENVGEHGVDVEGGEVTSARPVDGNAPGGAARKGTRSAGGQVVWEFEIEPDSDGDVTVSLEAGRPCDEPGAICTADGRALSEGISTTVRGPDEASASEPPDKPTGLTATASHDRVALTWDDPGDDTITGYVILRRIPGVDPQGHFNELVADTETTATSYTDDTVAAETRYTYRIKAINEHGTSERSRWFHIDTPAAPAPEEEQAAEPPDKPTGLTATESHGQVVLTWDDPGDGSITGYVVLRRVRENDTGGDFSVLVADTGSAATTYTDATVAAETRYTYRIKAINEHGTSERSRWYHIDIPEAP